jgi:hypothetical protein
VEDPDALAELSVTAGLSNGGADKAKAFGVRGRPLLVHESLNCAPQTRTQHVRPALTAKGYDLFISATCILYLTGDPLPDPPIADPDIIGCRLTSDERLGVTSGQDEQAALIVPAGGPIDCRFLRTVERRRG